MTSLRVTFWVYVTLCGIAWWAGVIGIPAWWAREVVVGDDAKGTKARPRPVLDQTTTYSTIDPSARSIPEFLLAKVEGMPDENWSVAKVTAFLRSQGFRVCCEEQHRRRDEHSRMFRLSNQNRPLHKVLDEIIAADPTYGWEFVTNSQIINIVPAYSRLNVPLQVLDGQDRRLTHCIDELHQPCKLHYGIFLMGNRQDPGRIENWPFQVRASHLRARDYLNQLAAQYDGMSWYLTSGTAVYFEVKPQEKFDRVAERLRAELKVRVQKLRAAVEGEGAEP